MKPLIATFFLLVFAAHSYACSTFLLSRNGHHVFGRNYDWVSGNAMVMVNARNVLKTSFMSGDNPSISWTSVYGSITFNQFGKEFPHGGMNEKGLVVEMMWLNETSYPAADKRAALNELQWIQYQLDKCATIEEVIATDKLIRINRQDAAPLHYLIADSAGHAATIEFIQGKMVVHKGDALHYPVLTNTIYADASTAYATNKNNPNAFDNSVARFATACNMLQQFKTTNQPPVDYAFSMLGKVSQPGYTKWSIVYDITNRQVYFITSSNRQRKQFALRHFNFSCHQPTLAFNINSNQTDNVFPFFTTLSFEQNKNVIARSARESSNRITISDAAIAKAAEYYGKVTCR